MSALGSTFSMGMTWGHLIQLSFSQKRPKHNFRVKGGAGYWHLYGGSSSILFLGHSMYHSDGYVSRLWLLRAQIDGDERGSHLVRSVLLNLDIEFLVLCFLYFVLFSYCFFFVFCVFCILCFFAFCVFFV